MPPLDGLPRALPPASFLVLAGLSVTGVALVASAAKGLMFKACGDKVGISRGIRLEVEGLRVEGDKVSRGLTG